VERVDPNQENFEKKFEKFKGPGSKNQIFKNRFFGLFSAQKCNFESKNAIKNIKFSF
jgi:hypothetical protein